MVYSFARLANFSILCCGRPQKYTERSFFRLLAVGLKCLILFFALFFLDMILPAFPIRPEFIRPALLLGQTDSIDACLYVFIALSSYLLHIFLPVISPYVADLINGNFRIFYLLSDRKTEDLLPDRTYDKHVGCETASFCGERKVYLLQGCLLQ